MSEEKKSEIRRCKHCGLLFEVTLPSNLKYCKVDCRKQAAVDKRREYRRAYREAHPLPKTDKQKGRLMKCPVCDKEFLSTYGRKYCSEECYKVNNGLNAQKRYVPRLRNCCQCGKELTGRQVKFCGQKCRDKYYREIQVSDEWGDCNEDRCVCRRLDKCKYAVKFDSDLMCGYMEITGHARMNYPDECKYFKEKSNG